jgi:hypothetical protein
MEGVSGCDMIILMLIQLIYLVRNELNLIELKKYPLSRKIRSQKHSKLITILLSNLQNWQSIDYPNKP